MAASFFLLCGLPLLAALMDETILADGNPHMQHPDRTVCCPAQALPPSLLLPSSTMLSRQADTFVKLEWRKHLGVPTPVFHFKQPARLSPHELPFSLVLASDINPSGIFEIPVPDANEAADSWFPDYSWSHWVVCSQPNGRAMHLGWKFTRKATASGSTAASPLSFIAMIVRTNDRDRTVAAAAAVEALAEGTAVVLPTGASEAPEGELTVKLEVEPNGEMEVQLESVPLGVEAPGWLAAMVAAVTATKVSMH